MIPSALQRELDACQGRTRRTLGISMAAHVALFAWLLVYSHLAPEAPALVEITWLEPEEAVAAPVVTSQEAEPEPVSAPAQTTQKFQRETPVAPVEPSPQRPEAMDDQLSERLAGLQPSSPAGRAPALAVSAPKSAWTRTPATAQQPTQDAPQRLVREPGSSGTVPVELRRNPTAPTRRSNLAVTEPPEQAARAEQARVEENTARRMLDGASLVGPVADRPLVSYRLPEYPDWARAQAIEGSVTLYFTVLPSGRVKESVLVEKTSGQVDFDRSAREALLAWRFAPLESAGGGEQWGRITFHFRLHD